MNNKQKTLVTRTDLAGIGISYSNTHLLKLEKDRLFPKRIYLSKQKVCWDFLEITDWLDAQRKRRGGLIMTKQFKLTDGMQSKSLKKVALAYAECGLPIFPVFGIGKNGECLCGDSKCEHQGKHPITKRGFKDATTDLVQIKKWWEEHPEANIGSTLMAGLFALDFDGAKGRKTYKELGLDKFKTLRSKTGKGFHLFVHADLKTKNNVLSGLDIRGGGKGGYIILPPSHHVSGQRYQWEV